MTVSLISITTNDPGYPNQFFISSASCQFGSVVPPATYPIYGVSSFTIKPGDICTFTLGFTPKVVGPVTGQITFIETAASSNICATGSLATCTKGSNGSLGEAIPLDGTGTGAPGISVSPLSLNFPNQPLGVPVTAPPIILVSTNTGGGGVPLYFAAVGIAPTSPNYADFSETNTCMTLSPLPPFPAAGNSCTITVTFTPSTTTPQESASLFITDDAVNPAPGNPTSIPLTGTGVAGTTTTTITSTSTTFDGYSLPTNVALVNTTPVTVKFTVQPASGGSPATGPVAVKDGFNDTCSATLTAASLGAGSCALTISQVGSGSTTLTATYNPDANSPGLLSSTSNPDTENIVEIVAPCNAVAGTPSAPAGSTIVASFVVCLAGNVNAVPPTVVITNCAPNSTCTVTIAAVPGQTGAYTVTISILTSAGSVPLQDPQPHRGPWPLTLFGFGALLAMLMALQLARQNRARPRLLYAAGLLFAMVLSGMSGCGGGSSNSNATPTGNYTINVKVTAGNFSVVVPVNVMVTK
jgi:hypothetical protein